MFYHSLIFTTFSGIITYANSLDNFKFGNHIKIKKAFSNFNPFDPKKVLGIHIIQELKNSETSAHGICVFNKFNNQNIVLHKNVTCFSKSKNEYFEWIEEVYCDKTFTLHRNGSIELHHSESNSNCILEINPDYKSQNIINSKNSTLLLDIVYGSQEGTDNLIHEETICTPISLIPLEENDCFTKLIMNIGSFINELL